MNLGLSEPNPSEVSAGLCCFPSTQLTREHPQLRAPVLLPPLPQLKQARARGTEHKPGANAPVVAQGHVPWGQLQAWERAHHKATASGNERIPWRWRGDLPPPRPPIK